MAIKFDNKDGEKSFVKNDWVTVKPYDWLDQYVADYNEKYCMTSALLSLKEQWETISERVKTFVDKENDNMKEIRTKGIVDLWFRKEYNKISEEMEDVRKSILNDDNLYLSVKTKVDEINSIIVEQGYDEVLIDLDCYTDNTTDKLLNDLDHANIVKIDTLKNKKTEILAMLSACDTYEQEMEVLKTYGVVDESGKLSI